MKHTKANGKGSRNGRRSNHSSRKSYSIPQAELMSSPLLPDGYFVPKSRHVHPSRRMRELLASEPYLFGPGVYDPMTAQLVMYYGFKAVYFSGYSFAIGHLGTTDMDLYASTEIADAARRTVSALRKFQLTCALGDAEKNVAPRHLHIPPLKSSSGRRARAINGSQILVIPLAASRLSCMVHACRRQ